MSLAPGFRLGPYDVIASDWLDSGARRRYSPRSTTRISQPSTASRNRGPLRLWFSSWSRGRRWQSASHRGRCRSTRLCHWHASDRVLVVPVTLGADDTVTVGAQTALFSTEPDTSFSVTPGGQRFLLNRPKRGAETPPITVVFNWNGPR